MNLSMSLIANYLEKYDPEMHITDDAQTIRGVRFFTDQLENYSLDYVYLGQAKGYFRDHRYADALLLANGQNQIICRGADYEALLNDVLGAFEFYNRFEQKLYMAAADHKPVGEMMQIIATVLKRTVLVFDLDGRMLGSANEEDLEDEKLRKSLKESDYIGLADIGNILVDKNGEIHHDLSDRPQFLRVAGQVGTGNEQNGGVSMYLYQEKERIGFVMIFVKDTLDIRTGLCLEPFFAKFCSEAQEFTDPSSLRQSNHSIMSLLLKNERVPLPVLEKFQAGLHFTGDAVLLLFNSRIIRNYTFRKRFTSELEQSDVPCICTEVEEHAAVLTDERHLDDALNLIRRKLPPQNIAIGVSMPIRQMELLHTALMQCKFALGDGNEAGVRFCQDLALPYLIRNLRENPMSPSLLHPVISLLERYDADNDTELLNTLRIYLSCRCSQSETAERLHVHLNTLKYRIRRITDLSGIDFHDQEELFYIELSFRIFDRPVYG